MKIYNLIGNEVKTLVNQEQLAAGNHLAIWDSTNESGQQVASGVYLYELLVGQSRITKKDDLFEIGQCPSLSNRLKKLHP